MARAGQSERVVRPSSRASDCVDSDLRQDAARAASVLRERIGEFESLHAGTTAPSSAEAPPVGGEVEPDGLRRRLRRRHDPGPGESRTPRRADGGVAATAAQVLARREARARERQMLRAGSAGAAAEPPLGARPEPRPDAAPETSAPEPAEPTRRSESSPVAPIPIADPGGAPAVVIEASVATTATDATGSTRPVEPAAEDDSGRWGADRLRANDVADPGQGEHPTSPSSEAEDPPLRIDGATDRPRVDDQDVTRIAEAITEAMVHALGQAGARPQPQRRPRSFWSAMWHADVMLWIVAMVLIAALLFAFAA